MVSEPIQPGQRIQEAHGLWEIQIARLAAFVEVGADKEAADRSLDG